MLNATCNGLTPTAGVNVSRATGRVLLVLSDLLSSCRKWLLLQRARRTERCINCQSESSGHLPTSSRNRVWVWLISQCIPFGFKHRLYPDSKDFAASGLQSCLIPPVFSTSCLEFHGNPAEVLAYSKHKHRPG